MDTLTNTMLNVESKVQKEYVKYEAYVKLKNAKQYYILQTYIYLNMYK